MEADLVKMSAKGQLVVPQNIREQEEFKPGDRFIPVAVKDGVLFKRISIPDLKDEFDKLAKQVERRFKKKGVTKQDIGRAMRWAKKSS